MAWLKEREIPFEMRDIKTQGPSKEELTRWIPLSGLPVERFWSTGSVAFRALKLKERLPDMSQEEQIRLMATDGMLLKRPLVVGEDFVLSGFRQGEWEERLGR